MLKIGSVRWRGKCSRHPRYDPYLDSRGAIRGGCERCALLADICAQHTELLALMKRFAPPPHKKRGRAELLDLQGKLFGDLMK